MAASSLLTSIHNLLAVYLGILALCSLSSATPVLTPTNLTTTDPADLTTPPPPGTEPPTTLPLTSLDSLDQLIRGVRVLRRHGFNQMLLGELYDSSNATLERGFYVFSVLMQSLQTIQLLEGNNMAAASSDNLAIFKVILNGVLNDTCQWFRSYDHTLDCTDRTHFLTVVLSMGLRPHLNNLECFLTGMNRFDGDQSLEPWVARTFVAEPVLGCQVCSTQNLQSCSNCS